VQREFYNAAAELGYPEADLTDATSAGVGIIPKNTRNGERESVDVSHLSAAMKRPNLTVLSHCVVERIICQNRMGNLTASAIETFVDGEAKSFFTNNVILSAGAVNSPAILMRSGIGDAKQLKEFGISPKLNLTGVGKNLVDHPSVSIWGVPKPGTNVIGEPIHQVMLRLGEASNEAVGSDLQLFMMGALQTKMFPPLDTLVNAETVDGISVMLGKPVSRGYIKLRGKSAKIPPSININCLDNRDDLERMKRGIRRAWEICQHPCLRKHIEKYVMWNSSIVQSDKLLQSMIQTTVRASMHPVGTLKMGADEDPDAVTDENGMLRGSDNITVADASIMPTITTVPPNMTCMVIGEKLASHLCNHL
jgi:choline dehydrogenase